MRVSEAYKLGKKQAFLDFVDIRLDTDLQVFVIPSTLNTLNSTWGHECASLVQGFFEVLLKNIKSGNDKRARELLASLSERNEFHLGLSKGRSNGHAFGNKSGDSVWEALSKSQAAISGLLEDLEDTCLLIHGIGSDMISDAVCNIIRGPLIKYTQDMCEYYDIPLSPAVSSGPIWNPVKEDWENTLVPLPVHKRFGKFILIPKNIVRHRSLYRFDDYYTHFLLPVMQQDELNSNTSLVRLLKNGKRRVTKKDLRAKYGYDKLSVVTQTLQRPEVLEKYKNKKNKNVPLPLEHYDLASLEGIDGPDWAGLFSEIKKIKSGKTDAATYENAIEKMLSSLFYPSLCYPKKQHNIHDGRKRIDITYTNEARVGFFYWLSQHYTAPYVFVECKNYGKDIGNPEFDQLSGRFSRSRGQVGFLFCRKIENKKKLIQSCKDTAADGRGYIIPLDDDDLDEIIKHKIQKPSSHEFPLLRDVFNKIIS